MAQELEWLGNEVLAIARNVLQRRGSARIIEIATSRVDVRGLLNEYRQRERQLAQSGINVTSVAIKVLREEWSDALNEHQRRAMVGR